MAGFLAVEVSQAEQLIVGSTMVSLFISFGCVMFGVTLFTKSIHVALLVNLLVLCVILCLVFFMVVVMDWPIGPIEVLSVIVFVGFAVDYCLHISHKYIMCHIGDVKEEISEDEDARDKSKFMVQPSGRSRVSMVACDKAVATSKKPLPKKEVHLLKKNKGAERFERTRYALQRMGAAVVGSGLTTLGSAAFLIPCMMLIFSKIGYVVVGVSLYAMCHALLPLPAVLMTMGPCKNDWDWLCRTKEGEEQEGPSRRYVLHIPVSRAGAYAPEAPKAARTQIRANG